MTILEQAEAHLVQATSDLRGTDFPVQDPLSEDACVNLGDVLESVYRLSSVVLRIAGQLADAKSEIRDLSAQGVQPRWRDLEP